MKKKIVDEVDCILHVMTDALLYASLHSDLVCAGPKALLPDISKRVAHLALFVKKRRVRKKNRNRALKC